MKKVIKGLGLAACAIMPSIGNACTDMCWSYEAVMAKRFQGDMRVTDTRLNNTAYASATVSSPNSVEFMIRAARDLSTIKNNVTISAGGELGYSTTVTPRYQVTGPNASIVTHIHTSSIAGTFKALKAFGGDDDVKAGALIGLGIDLPIVKNDYSATTFGTTRSHVTAQPFVKLVMDVLKPITTTKMAIGAEVSVKQVLSSNAMEGTKSTNTSMDQMTTHLPKTTLSLGVKLTAL